MSPFNFAQFVTFIKSELDIVRSVRVKYFCFKITTLKIITLLSHAHLVTKNILMVYINMPCGENSGVSGNNILNQIV